MKTPSQYDNVQFYPESDVKIINTTGPLGIITIDKNNNLTGWSALKAALAIETPEEAKRINQKAADMASKGGLAFFSPSRLAARSRP